MNLYVAITIAVLAVPLALSFDKRVAYVSHWRQLFVSMVSVSAIYIIWDVLVTERGTGLSIRNMQVLGGCSPHCAISRCSANTWHTITE